MARHAALLPGVPSFGEKTPARKREFLPPFQRGLKLCRASPARRFSRAPAKPGANLTGTD